MGSGPANIWTIDMTSLSGPSRDNVGRGILLALSATLIFSTQDAISKFLVQSDVSPFQMTMMRFWGTAVFALALAWWQGGGTITQPFAVRSQSPLRPRMQRLCQTGMRS